MTQAKVAHWTFFTEIAKNWHENVEILCCVVALSVIYAQGLVRFFVNLGNFLQLYTQQWLYYYVTEISMWFLRRSKVLCSLIPRPTPKRKGGSSEYILQHFFIVVEFQPHNLIGWCGNYLTCTGLPYHKALSFTHHTFTDLLSKPSNLLAQQETSKA